MVETVKLTAIMLARNEEWILGCSLRVALRWCDEVVILDHGSTDATPDIITDMARAHPGRVHTIRVRATDGWHEQTHRQMAYATAVAHGGTHFAIIDADEVPTGNLLAGGGLALRDLISDGKLSDGQMVALREFCLWESLDAWRTDGAFAPERCRQIVLGFPHAPNLHWQPREDGYHLHARYPMGHHGIWNPCPSWIGGGIMHLQFADMRRHRAKNWWYRMVERIQHPGKRTPQETNEMYGWCFEGTPETRPAEYTTPEGARSFWDGIPERRYITLGAKPWHEDEIERLLAKHGTEPFRGLYLGPYTERIAA